MDGKYPKISNKIFGYVAIKTEFRLIPSCIASNHGLYSKTK